MLLGGCDPEAPAFEGGASGKASLDPESDPPDQATLEAHPKSFHVQEAVAKGCCALFLDGQQNFGGQIATLWPVLWPLAVHPRAQIAQASSLALCRMTWLSRGGDVELPSAEKAMDMACSEVSSCSTSLCSPIWGGN